MKRQKTLEKSYNENKNWKFLYLKSTWNWNNNNNYNEESNKQKTTKFLHHILFKTYAYYIQINKIKL